MASCLLSYLLSVCAIKKAEFTIRKTVLRILGVFDLMWNKFLQFRSIKIIQQPSRVSSSIKIKKKMPLKTLVHTL